MSKDDHRRGRKDDSRRERRGYAAGALLAIALLALAALPAAAPAATGGLTTTHAARAISSTGLAFSPLRSAGATWYGPGLYGNTTACGHVLRPNTVGVAHRRLPCGTPVRIVYRGRSLITRVIDRGPYSRGHDWDLTNGARLILGFEGSNTIRFAIARRYARR